MKHAIMIAMAFATSAAVAGPVYTEADRAKLTRDIYDACVEVHRVATEARPLPNELPMSEARIQTICDCSAKMQASYMISEKWEVPNPNRPNMDNASRAAVLSMNTANICANPEAWSTKDAN